MRKLAMPIMLGVVISCSLTTSSGLSTPERNGFSVLSNIHFLNGAQDLFPHQRHRETRATPDMAKVFGTINVNTFITTKHIAESIYEFFNCAENNNFKIKVLMLDCEPKPILTCFHDGDTGLVSGSISSDLTLNGDLKPNGSKKLDIHPSYCNILSSEQSISGLALGIPGKHSFLGTGQNFTVYSGRFESCNVTMLIAANRAGKSVTVRKRSCEGSQGRPPTTQNINNAQNTHPGHDGLSTVSELMWTSTEEPALGSSSFSPTTTYSRVEITTPASTDDTGVHTGTELSGITIFLIVIAVLVPFIIAVVVGAVITIRKRHRFRRVPTKDLELSAR